MSLKDELLKAKLISKKQLKKIEHEKRIAKTKLGTEGVAQKKEEREAELAAKIKAQKEKNKQQAKLKKEELVEKEKIARIKSFVRNAVRPENRRGNRKFYFVASDKKIPYLTVSDDIAVNLETGRLAIIEYEQEFMIIDGKSAKNIEALDSGIIRFWQTK